MNLNIDTEILNKIGVFANCIEIFLLARMKGNYENFNL